MFGSVPNDFRSQNSMRPTKCDHAQVKRTLRSGVRGQNEGKFGGFGCDTFLTKVYITLNSSTTLRDRAQKLILYEMAALHCPKSITWNFLLPSLIPPIFSRPLRSARAVTNFYPQAQKVQRADFYQICSTSGTATFGGQIIPLLYLFVLKMRIIQ